MPMHVQNVLRELDFIDDVIAVGGCVRDTVIGREPSDVDVASSLGPRQFIEACNKQGLNTYPVGLEFGTVMVKVLGHKVEHTTFRKDMATDGRHAVVEYADSFKEDAARRDFTMNAIGMDADGRIFDPYDGIEDIEQEVVRCVGKPMTRFQEDYLRIIRMCRYAGRYDFAIGEETSAAAMALSDQVPRYVAVERVTQEINKAFADERPSRFLRHFKHYGLLEEYLGILDILDTYPQSPEYHPEGDVWEHTLEVVDRAPRAEKNGWRYLRWAALLHDSGKPLTAKKGDSWWYSFPGHEKAGAEKVIPKVAGWLKFPNWLTQKLKVLTRHHMYPLHVASEATEDGMPDRLRRRFQVNVEGHLEDMEALCRADGEDRRPDQVWDLFEPLETPPERVLTGNDLIDAGFEPGPKFGTMLEAAHEHQIETGCRDKDELLEVAINALAQESTIS